MAKVCFTTTGYLIEGKQFWLCTEHDAAPPFTRAIMHAYKYHMSVEQRKKVGQEPLRSKVDYPEVREWCVAENCTGTQVYEYIGKLSRTNKGWLKTKAEIRLEEQRRAELAKAIAEKEEEALLRQKKLERERKRRHRRILKELRILRVRVAHLRRQTGNIIINCRKRRREDDHVSGPGVEVSGEDETTLKAKTELDVNAALSTLKQKGEEVSRKEEEIRVQEEALQEKDTLFRKKQMGLWMEEAKMRDKLDKIELRVDRSRAAARERREQLSVAAVALKENQDLLDAQERELQRKKSSVARRWEFLDQETTALRADEEEVDSIERDVSARKAAVELAKKDIAAKMEELERVGCRPVDYIQAREFVLRLHRAVVHKDRLIRSLQCDLRRARRGAEAEENQFPEQFYTYMVCLARECFRLKGHLSEETISAPHNGFIRDKTAKTLHCFLSFNMDRVLCAKIKSVVIDTENLCHSDQLGRKDFLLAIPFLRKLQKLGFRCILVLPSRRKKSNFDNITQLQDEKTLASLNASVRYVDYNTDDSDDHMVLRLALERHAVVLSNDKYKDYALNPVNSRGLRGYLNRWQLNFKHEGTQLLTTSSVPVTDFNISHYLLHDRQAISANIHKWIFDDLRTTFVGESQFCHTEGSLLDLTGFVRDYRIRLMQLHRMIPM